MTTALGFVTWSTPADHWPWYRPPVSLKAEPRRGFPPSASLLELHMASSCCLDAEQWASQRPTEGGGGSWGRPSKSRLIVASPRRRQVARWHGGGAWCASIFAQGRRDPKRQRREEARACSCCIHPRIGSPFPCFSSCANSAYRSVGVVPKRTKTVEERAIMSTKTDLAGLNARGSRRQWWGTTKPAREDARECSRGVLHPPLPLSWSESLPHARPWAAQTGKAGVFVRHCASLSTSIIHEGSRVHGETCAYACMRACCLYLHNTAEQRRGAVFSTRNVTESTRCSSAYSSLAGTHPGREARLPVCLCPLSLSLPRCVSPHPSSHSPSLASLPSLPRCRTSVLVCRLPQGRWWDVRDHFPGWSRRRHGEDGAAQPAPGHQVLRQPCQVHFSPVSTHFRLSLACFFQCYLLRNDDMNLDSRLHLFTGCSCDLHFFCVFAFRFLFKLNYFPTWSEFSSGRLRLCGCLL